MPMATGGHRRARSRLGIPPPTSHVFDRFYRGGNVLQQIDGAGPAWRV
jgi:hypothetical protein